MTGSTSLKPGDWCTMRYVGLLDNGCCIFVINARRHLGSLDKHTMRVVNAKAIDVSLMHIADAGSIAA